MTDPSASRRTAWAAVSAALVLAGVLAGCSDLIAPVPIATPVRIARASQPPSPSPTPSPVRPTPSAAVPTPSPLPTVEIPEVAAPKPQWEAASTTFKNRANALKRLAKLRAKGFTGYRIERDKDRYEVEREFSTMKRAAAEVRRLARAGFRAKVEESTEPT